MSAEIRERVLAYFREKSKGEKKMFYIKDVVKGLPDVDRHAVQEDIGRAARRTDAGGILPEGCMTARRGFIPQIGR